MRRACPLSNFGAAFAAVPEPVNPADFITPEGAIDWTPLNTGERDHVAAIDAFRARLRAGDSGHQAPSQETTR